jgi:hypothetical protein
MKKPFALLALTFALAFAGGVSGQNNRNSNENRGQRRHPRHGSTCPQCNRPEPTPAPKKP